MPRRCCVLGGLEDRPLRGRMILVPRPAGDAHELGRRLEELGAQVVRVPLHEIRSPARLRLPARLDRYAWIAFTSAQAVTSFLARWLRGGRDLRSVSPRLAAVGPGTARALESLRLRADLVSPDGTVRGLARALARRVRRGDHVLHPCADVHSPEMAAALRTRGAAVDELVVYVVRELRPRFPAAATRADSVAFTSAETVRRFLRAAPAALAARLRDGLRAVSIGPRTSEAVREAGYPVRAEARPHTFEGVVEALCRL